MQSDRAPCRLRGLGAFGFVVFSLESLGASELAEVPLKSWTPKTTCRGWGFVHPHPFTCVC